MNKNEPIELPQDTNGIFEFLKRLDNDLAGNDVTSLEVSIQSMRLGCDFYIGNAMMPYGYFEEILLKNVNKNNVWITFLTITHILERKPIMTYFNVEFGPGAEE